MPLKFIRTLRTASSEQFVVNSDTAENVAMIDIHFLPNSHVTGSVVVFDHQLLSTDNVELLLQGIDETLLPMASLDGQNLRFTVIKGSVFGEFENTTSA